MHVISTEGPHHFKRTSSQPKRSEVERPLYSAFAVAVALALALALALASGIRQGFSLGHLIPATKVLQPLGYAFPGAAPHEIQELKSY
jgi:hypothetical protein